ncbi:MAG: hypothetical protein LBG48_01000 [Rickettsiales bacterium]|jgi:hypothetical protein|nr:hypothetical protein [Rickettsiales bacterium]
MSDANISDSLNKELPAYFSRQEASKYIGGLFRANTLRNLDSQGKGPTVKLRVGRKILYERKNFIDWLINYGPR